MGDRKVSFYLDGIKRAVSATSAAQKELKEQADDGMSAGNTTFTWSVMQEYDVAGLSDVPNAAYAYYQPHLKGDSMSKAASTNDVCAQGDVDFPLHVLHAAGGHVRGNNCLCRMILRRIMQTNRTTHTHTTPHTT